MGGSRARIGRPEIQEPGRAEALPRTAAIARKCERKKAPAIVKGALLRLYQVGRPNPIAELAATIKG